MNTPLFSVAGLIRWARKSLVILIVSLWTLALAGPAGANTYNVTVSAAQIVNAIHADGDYLHGTYSGSNAPTGAAYWGIIGLYILPDLTPGSYTLSSPSTTVASWGGSIPNSNDPFQQTHYTANNYAAFQVTYLYPTNVGMITDSAMTNFPTNFSTGPPLVKIADSDTFSFTVTAAAWSGSYHFLADGEMYNLADTQSNPTYGIPYNFFGGYVDSLGLVHNGTTGYGGDYSQGYGSGPAGPVPLPGSLLLLGTGLVGLVGLRRGKWLSR